MKEYDFVPVNNEEMKRIVGNDFCIIVPPRASNNSTEILSGENILPIKNTEEETYSQKKIVWEVFENNIVLTDYIVNLRSMDDSSHHFVRENSWGILSRQNYAIVLKKFNNLVLSDSPIDDNYAKGEVFDENFVKGIQTMKKLPLELRSILFSEVLVPDFFDGNILENGNIVMLRMNAEKAVVVSATKRKDDFWSVDLWSFSITDLVLECVFEKV